MACAVAGTETQVKEEFRASPTLRLPDGSLVIPIVRLWATVLAEWRAGWGELAPVAVVLVASSRDIMVQRVDGKTDPLEHWLARVPGLAEQLNGWSSSTEPPT